MGAVALGAGSHRGGTPGCPPHERRRPPTSSTSCSPWLHARGVGTPTMASKSTPGTGRRTSPVSARGRRVARQRVRPRRSLARRPLQTAAGIGRSGLCRSCDPNLGAVRESATHRSRAGGWPSGRRHHHRNDRRSPVLVGGVRRGRRHGSHPQANVPRVRDLPREQAVEAESAARAVADRLDPQPVAPNHEHAETDRRHPLFYSAAGVRTELSSRL